MTDIESAGPVEPGKPTLRDCIRSEWDGKPPPREWLAGSGRDGWLPAGRVAMLTGPGESGKSRLALQLAAAVAGDGGAEARRVIPSDRAGEDAAEDAGPVIAAADPGTVALIGWEDQADEAWRRVDWLRAAGVKTAGALANRLHYLDAAAAGIGALWGPEAGEDADTVATWTAAGLDVLAWLESLDGLRLVILDPLAAAFGASENNRAAVRPFLARLNARAARLGAAVVIVAHPAKGDGPQAIYSGSTDWRNGVRALWTLRRERVPGYETPKPGDGKAPPEAPALTLEKASYGGGSGTRVWLRSAGDPQAGDGLAWRECSARDALQAEAVRRGLATPARTDRTDKHGDGANGPYAPGEVA